MINVGDYIKWSDKQEIAFQHIGTGSIIFYGGARGGGKSFFSLASAVLACLQYPRLTVVVVRKYYSQLEEYFIIRLKQQFPEKLFKYKFVKQSRTAQFANGARIIFRAAERKSDVEKVQGLEYQFIIIDEANQFSSDALSMFQGSLRTALDNGFVPTFLMTGNPGGMSDLYFKTHFINPDYGYWSPQELKYRDRYIFVPALLDDNPFVDQDDYRMRLESQTDENRLKAWLYGDWNSFAGQFFESFQKETHTVPYFVAPKDWRRVCGLDLGYSREHPTVFLLAVQDPASMRVYITKEYVGVGSVEENALRIKQMLGDELELIREVYADPSMFETNRKKYETDDSSHIIFQKCGLPLFRANNARIDGWRIVKQWMDWSEQYPPMLKICTSCTHTVHTLPLNKYTTNKIVNAEDMDTTGPDDAADALRYMMVSGFGYPTRDTAHLNLEVYKKYTEDVVQETKTMENLAFTCDVDADLFLARKYGGGKIVSRDIPHGYSENSFFL